MINRIVNRDLDKGCRQVKRVMASIHAQLDDLGKRVENHKRATPTPAFARRANDDMDAPGHSLAHLQTCARGLRDATWEDSLLGTLFDPCRLAYLAYTSND